MKCYTLMALVCLTNKDVLPCCIAIHVQYYVLIITDDSQTDVSDILPIEVLCLFGKLFAVGVCT